MSEGPDPLDPSQRAFFRGTRLWLTVAEKIVFWGGGAVGAVAGLIAAANFVEKLLGEPNILLIAFLSALTMPAGVMLLAHLPLRGLRRLRHRLDHKERLALHAARNPRAVGAASTEGAPVAVAVDRLSDDAG